MKEIDKTDNFNIARAYICVKNDKIEIEKETKKKSTTKTKKNESKTGKKSK